MKLGIVSSVLMEIEYILSKCTNIKKQMIKRMAFYQCQYNGYELIVAVTGVGKTNASIHTQILIDNFQPDALIGLGVGGSLTPSLQPLDVVLGTSFYHYDVRVEQMKNTFPFKSHFRSDVRLLKHFSKYVEADKTGKVVSGEAFVGGLEKKKEIISAYPQSLVVDMESSSMAQCSFINDIPFISLIGITDFADDSASEVYYANDVETSNIVGELFLKILKKKNQITKDDLINQ